MAFAAGDAGNPAVAETTTRHTTAVHRPGRGQTPEVLCRRGQGHGISSTGQGQEKIRRALLTGDERANAGAKWRHSSWPKAA